MIFQRVSLTGFNLTKFSELAGVNERKLFFATMGLLTPQEFLEDDFIERIDNAIGGITGKNPDINRKGGRLLLSSAQEG